MDFPLYIGKTIQMIVTVFVSYHLIIGIGKIINLHLTKGNPNQITRSVLIFIKSHPIFFGFFIFFFVVWILTNAGWTLPLDY